MNQKSPKDPKSILILTMKLLYTYFWKMLPIGPLIWLTLIWLIWAEIAQPTSNHVNIYEAESKYSDSWHDLGGVRPMDQISQVLCLSLFMFAQLWPNGLAETMLTVRILWFYLVHMYIYILVPQNFTNLQVASISWGKVKSSAVISITIFREANLPSAEGQVWNRDCWSPGSPPLESCWKQINKTCQRPNMFGACFGLENQLRMCRTIINAIKRFAHSSSRDQRLSNVTHRLWSSAPEDAAANFGDVDHEWVHLPCV